MHLTNQSIGIGLDCCSWFAVLCYLFWPSTLLEMIALTFLSLLQLPAGFLYGLYCQVWCTKAGTWTLLSSHSFSTLVYLPLLPTTWSCGSQAAVAYTSVGIAFLTIVGIFIYHIYMRIKSKVLYIQRGRHLQQKKNGERHGKCGNNNLENFCEGTPNVEHHCQSVIVQPYATNYTYMGTQMWNCTHLSPYAIRLPVGGLNTINKLVLLALVAGDSEVLHNLVPAQYHWTTSLWPAEKKGE